MECNLHRVLCLVLLPVISGCVERRGISPVLSSTYTASMADFRAYTVKQLEKCDLLPSTLLLRSFDFRLPASALTTVSCHLGLSTASWLHTHSTGSDAAPVERYTPRFSTPCSVLVTDSKASTTDPLAQPSYRLQGECCVVSVEIRREKGSMYLTYTLYKIDSTINEEGQR